MGETVLVTGGTGYVAGWCIAALLERGYTVRTTVRTLGKRPAVADERVSVVVADLTSDAGWAGAVDGCDYVLHVASPLGADNPKDPQALIGPARDGALRVLRAATAAGVERVVLTSACAAASPALYTEDGVTDETLWTDPDDPRLTPYRRSKTLAELAAWQHMSTYEGPTTLATVLPGAVFGPVLPGGPVGTAQVIGRMLRGRPPGNPRIGFEVVDVRDLADAHIRAMVAPAAAGERFIAVGDFMWMGEIARTLRDRLGPAARRVPTRTLPDFVPRVAALFDPELRAVLPALGRTHRHSAEKARRVLDWRPRPASETIVDCATSLLGRPEFAR